MKKSVDQSSTELVVTSHLHHIVEVGFVLKLRERGCIYKYPILG